MQVAVSVGDNVVIKDSHYASKARGLSGVVIHVSTHPQRISIVKCKNFTRVHGFNNDEWCVLMDDLQRTPSVADDLTLPPQSKAILRHLKKHGHVSPAKALIVYGISRLADCIYRIRKIGYNVDVKLLKDDQGHKYAYYELKK